MPAGFKVFLPLAPTEPTPHFCSWHDPKLQSLHSPSSQLLNARPSQPPAKSEFLGQSLVLDLQKVSLCEDTLPVYPG